MFKIILYPTDFSDNAGKSIDYLKQLHNAGAEKIILLNVIHQRILDTMETIHKAAYFQDGRYHEDRDDVEQKLEQDRSNKIAPIAVELEAAGFEVKIRIEKGSPAREILKVEQEEAVSAIVMTSHGRSNFPGTRIGSVSGKVIRRSVTPVLLVKR
ncbi:MAG: universal stress protein [Deltaproteobacteria bacterium]|nr:universal stress protein [Deltaproteobacteria bacterium]